MNIQPKHGVYLFSLILAGFLGGCQPGGRSLVAETETSVSDELITPVDKLPLRDFSLGFSSVIPPDGDLEKAYQQASNVADFASLWVGSNDVGAWNLADVLGGAWGDTFLGEYIRGNGLIPIINLSFLDIDSH